MLANFRSQARVIDLLGREQIADAPTALGELFKNALDAAANKVWVDYKDERDLLTVRDNGLGMRTNDVTDKWLVLATDSSHRPKEGNKDWTKYATEEQLKWLSRPRYGEKGIGRLSVAILGRLAVIWTVWGEKKEKTGTLCIVHWNLFRHPKKLFGDLPIPVHSFTKAPSRKEIQTIFREYLDSDSIQALINDETWGEALRKELQTDLTNLIEKGFIEDKTLPWESGTTFYIEGLSEHVPELFRKANRELPPEEERSSDFLKSYHAFETFWDPFHEHNSGRDFEISATTNGKVLNRENRFWTPQDFERSDHHIRIEVDENGFAKGTLKNYKNKPIQYSKQFKSFPKHSYNPGKFTIEIGYVQGIADNSPLSSDDFVEMNNRLEHAGGFSIYLDSVRIQPYGTRGSDFAEFETRRALNAGRYYFASRRMFGGVFLDRLESPKLVEKAGREGFVANGASRGLKYLVREIFIDLADSHYGRKADRPDKEKAKRRSKAKKQAAERLKKEKKTYLSAIRTGRKEYEKEVITLKALLQKTNQYLTSESNSEPGTYLSELEEQVTALRVQANSLRERQNPAPPGVTLSPSESDLVDDYITKCSHLQRSLDKRIVEFTRKLDSASEKHRSKLDHIAWIKQRYNSISLYEEEITELIEPILNKHGKLSDEIRTIGQQQFQELKEHYQEQLGKLTPKSLAADRSGKSTQKLENAIQSAETYYLQETKPHIEQIANEINHLLEGTSSIVLIQEYADRISQLEERESHLIELAQLGLITEAASHEHEHHVEKIRLNIQFLRNCLLEKELQRLEQLADSFEIVDMRMRMFDPLIRRRGVITSTLSGETIFTFLREHFQGAIEDGILEHTKHFPVFEFHSIKKPIILGAIFNLVHNALYWCRKGDSDQPKIRLDGFDGVFSISDSGPGIESRDQGRIFDPGFSRRPYGRGLGLFIAKEALLGLGYQLSLESEPTLTGLDGANFIIQSISQDHDE